MRILFLFTIVAILSGLNTVHCQTVKYGNNETVNYDSSYQSADFTYLMWDLNDDGDGNFKDAATPKFFYWDNDAGKLNFLLDTGNMSQLDAGFNSLILKTKATSYENLLELQVSDAAGDYFKINNSTGVSSQFMPSLRGKHVSDNRQALSLIGITSSEEDTGNRPLISFDARIDNGPVVNRPLMNWRNYTNEKMILLANGNLGIGTSNPTSKLSVNGTIKAKEVTVSEDLGADFVFDDDYPLPGLNEIEASIKRNKHLPGIPSANEMKKNGVHLGNLQMKLLQKIEELTLYVINLEKRVDDLEKENKSLKNLKTRNPVTNTEN